tara:strand:- start:1698 stop:2666 length:969 start_codon:yes stop_codon:yes gene_type:complete
MAATDSKTYPITPESLKALKFNSVKRGGYDPNEVDLFLHQLIAILNESPNDIFGLSSTKPEDPESAAQRLLSAAQRTADQIIRDAKEQTSQLLASAEAQVDNVKRIVAEEARQMAEKAEAELRQSLYQLAEDKRKLQDDCAELSGQLQAGKDQLLSTIDEIKSMIEDDGLLLPGTQLPLEAVKDPVHQSVETYMLSDNEEIQNELEIDESQSLQLSQSDLVSVDELMDSPPELTLIRNKESNEDWLDKAVLKTEKDLSDSEVADLWDSDAPTELIQAIVSEEINSGDRFFEALEDEEKSSSLGKVDDETNQAMDDFFKDEEI